MEIEQPHEGEGVSHQADKTDDDQDVSYGTSQPIEELVPYQSDKLLLWEQHVPCQANQPLEQ